MDTCGECGYLYDLTAAPAASREITAGVAALIKVLKSTDRTTLAQRSSPDLWSPLEYCCHVRDVLLVQRERALLARRDDNPVATPMGRDERVIHEGYGAQDPLEVAMEMLMASRLMANVLDRLNPADWRRRITYNFPEPAQRNLRWLAAHTLHEVRHHLLDVQRQLG